MFVQVFSTSTSMIWVTLYMPSAAEECCKPSGNFTLSGEWSPWYNYYTNSPWYNYCTNYYTNYYTNSPWYNYQRLWFDMYSVLSMQCSIQIVMYVCMHKIAIYLPASGMNCWILSEKKINQLVYIFVLEHRDILRASGQWATCSKLSCSTAVVGNWTCSLCFDLSLKLAPFGRSYTTSYPTSY